ncbi:MAG: hypothetical protein WBA39_03575 [Rivularia sp. (in: cyanobacteria)]
MDEYLDMPGIKKKIVDGFNFLGLGNFTSLITNIKFADWGRTVLIDCVYHPQTRLKYQIIFYQCDKIKWSIIDSEIVNEREADVIDFQIEKDGDKEYAYFHTDIFDLLIYYESIKIEKDW